MTQSLLPTKFYLPPSSPNTVLRPRLIQELTSSLSKPLTLLVAPAGYGKTTLLSGWMEAQTPDLDLAYLSLDSRDNELVRFQLYLNEALRKIDPGLTQHSSQLLLDSGPPAPDLFCTALVNDLALFEGTLVLVLDNYHLIENREIHRNLEFLIDHLPPRIHLALLSRADPPFPLARLRAGGSLAEIRAADLRFSLPEAASFLNQTMELGLAAEEIDALEERTEGWIAGLQLAALSLTNIKEKGRFIADFSGSNRFILDYLVEEVLDHQPEELRAFLLRTSLLDSLSGPLCDSLLGRTGSREILLQLYHSNLFLVPLDTENTWFRYHRLFSDLLQKQLASDPAEDIRMLRRLAGDWYDANHMPVEAIDQAFLCADFAWAGALLKKHFPAWQLVENRGRYQAWFSRLPEEVLQADPWLCLQYAKILLGRDPSAKLKTCLDYVQTALQRSSQEQGAPSAATPPDELQAELRTIQAWVAVQEGNPQQALDLAHQALGWAPGTASSIKASAWNVLQLVYRDQGEVAKALEACRAGLPESLASKQVSLIVSIYNIYGGLLLIQGQLREAAEIYSEALSAGEKMANSGVVGFSMIRLRLADIYYQWNRIDEAEGIILEALERVDLGDDLFGMIYGRYLLLLVCSARRDRSRMERIWREIKGILPRTRDALYSRELQRLLELTKLRLGLEERSDVEIQPPDLALPEQIPSREIELRLLEARFGLETDRLQGLEEYLSRLELAACQRDHQYWLIQIHILQAILQMREGNPDRAARALVKALEVGEGQAFMRVFLDEADLLQDLLRAARSRLQAPRLADYAGRIWTALQAEKPSGLPAQQPLVEPLSERELQVLTLIAEGKSNQEVAEALVIAVGTVKRHTVNIFNKLLVKNRTEAVAKARLLDIL